MKINIYQRFLLVVASVFFLILFLLACFNYYYDPANIFASNQYEAGVAKILLSGKNAANVTNYDERLLQKRYVENLSDKKDTLVLGSSRAMNISAKLFPGQKFFNSSVSGATLEDIYAIFQLYKEHNLEPKNVVIGIDPWIFNRNNGQTRWKSLEIEYLHATLPYEDIKKIKNKKKYRLSKLLELISFDYFIASWKSRDYEAKHYFATDATELNVNIRLSDGTISYRHDITYRTEQEVADIVNKQITRSPFYSLDKYSELDLDHVHNFTNLIKRLKIDGLSVTLFLAPYHPDMYKAIMRSESPYQMVGVAESFLIKFARENQIALIGSYNPDLVSCGRGDFFDEMHPKPACIERVFHQKLAVQSN